AAKEVRQEPLHVCLTHLESQPLVEGRAEGNLVEQATIDPGQGDDASFSTGLDRLSQHGRAVRLQSHGLLRLVISSGNSEAVGFESDCIDAGIGSAASGHFSEGLENVFVLVVDDLRATMLTREGESVRHAIDRDYLLRSQEV